MEWSKEVLDLTLNRNDTFIERHVMETSLDRNVTFTEGHLIKSSLDLQAGAVKRLIFSLIRRTFTESAQKLISEKSRAGIKPST